MKKDLIALCAIGRMENRYAREFVAHYKALGFDRIFIYDNNFGSEERFEEVLDDYIADGLVEVIDYRDRRDAQKSAYADCYQKHGCAYRWIAFFDFDEFLTIVDDSDIHTFMRRYEGADCLLVNWRIYTDNDLLRYDDRPVMERFTEPMPVDTCVTYDFPENRHTKSIVRGGLPTLAFRKNPHVPSEPLLSCVRTDGISCSQDVFQSVDHSTAYLRHYTTKTIEEWMSCKVLRGFPSSERLNSRWRARHLEQFFAINKRTPEKEKIVEEFTKPIGTAMIDFVVPMVFSDDSQWQQDLNLAVADDQPARWRSWKTEKLLIALVRKNMPWLRTIHILLARESQVRPWMLRMQEEPGPKIHLVFHRDFVEQQFLPCFVSRTIEMFLHRIPDLAERFIYANDDMFPLSPLRPEDFFRDGKPCQRVHEKQFPKENPNLFEQACLHGLNMIAADFGRRFTDTWLRNGHTFQPILLSTCREVWRRHGEAIRACISPRRNGKSYNQYLYFYWQQFSGNFVYHAPARRFFTIRKHSPYELRDILLAPDAGIVCVNDHEDRENWQDYATVTRDCLKEVLERS